MGRKARLKFDEIGYWSEMKLEIIDDYARAYSKIISACVNPSFEYAFIDAFAGPGEHKSKRTGEMIPGSPQKALAITPSFKKYYFIDLDSRKAEHLRNHVAGNRNVTVYTGDCNAILLKDVFPHVRFEDYKRGLCLLDPYGLDLSWGVMETAGRMRSIEIFLNFPIMDMNRNVFWADPSGVDPEDIKRMNTFWGDDSWRNIAYTRKKNLFGYEEKESGDIIAESFRRRLQNMAGFAHVSKPLPMRNSINTIIYYLFFASQRPVAKKIIDHIFNKYAKVGAK